MGTTGTASSSPTPNRSLVSLKSAFTLQSRTGASLRLLIRLRSADSGETADLLLNGLLLAVGLQLEQRKRWLQDSAGVPLMFLGAAEEETEMDGDYVKAMAWAMLAKGARRLRDLQRAAPTGSAALLEGNLCG